MKKNTSFIKFIVFFAAVLTFAGCLALLNQRQYYIREYEPIYLTSDNITSSAEEHSISGLTCISYENAYCNTAALGMIAAYLGIDNSLHYYNWLTGFSYGAGTVAPGHFSSFLPYTDPEPGNRIAAPYLGLERKYYVTDDKELYRSAVKFYLSRDYPLRVVLNASVYREIEGFLPHAILLSGYSASEVSYYETGGADNCSDGNADKEMSWDTLFSAVESMGGVFGYPWKYNLTVFDLASEKETDLTKVWERIEYNLVGYNYGTVVGGSMAIIKLADEVKRKDLSAEDWDVLQNKMNMCVYTRTDNVTFMQGKFDDDDLMDAAGYLDAARVIYQRIYDTIEAGDPDKQSVIDDLLECAGLEEQAGLSIGVYFDID